MGRPGSCHVSAGARHIDAGSPWARGTGLHRSVPARKGSGIPPRVPQGRDCEACSEHPALQSAHLTGPGFSDAVAKKHQTISLRPGARHKQRSCQTTLPDPEGRQGRPPLKLHTCSAASASLISLTCSSWHAIQAGSAVRSKGRRTAGWQGQARREVHRQVLFALPPGLNRNLRFRMTPEHNPSTWAGLRSGHWARQGFGAQPEV